MLLNMTDFRKSFTNIVHTVRKISKTPIRLPQVKQIATLLCKYLNLRK